MQAGVATLLKLLGNDAMPLREETIDIAEAEEMHWPLQDMIKSLQQGNTGLAMAKQAAQQFYNSVPADARQSRHTFENWSLGVPPAAATSKPSFLSSICCCW